LRRAGRPAAPAGHHAAISGEIRGRTRRAAIREEKKFLVFATVVAPSAAALREKRNAKLAFARQTCDDAWQETWWCPTIRKTKELFGMKKLLAFGAVCAAVALSGCVFPGKGPAYSALTLNQISSDPVVDGSARPIKRGEAYSGGILFLTGGDASITAAMKNGGLRKVHHVDYKVNNYFWLWNDTTTIVYGE
jgi:hypothetical protein